MHAHAESLRGVRAVRRRRDRRAPCARAPGRHRPARRSPSSPRASPIRAPISPTSPLLRSLDLARGLCLRDRAFRGRRRGPLAAYFAPGAFVDRRPSRPRGASRAARSSSRRARARRPRRRSSGVPWMRFSRPKATILSIGVSHVASPTGRRDVLQHQVDPGLAAVRGAPHRLGLLGRVGREDRDTGRRRP